MRKLVCVKKWSICLVAVAAAACGGTAENNMAASDSVAAGNAAAPAETNAAAPADANATAPAADANAAAPAGDSYHAVGTVPYWSLTIDASQMAYDTPEGPDVTVATPPVQNTRAGKVYRTPQITVFISAFRDCTFPSGEQEGNIVRVTIGGETVTGCGSGNLPA